MARIFLFTLVFGFLLGYSVRGHAAETPVSRSVNSTKTQNPRASAPTHALSVVTTYGSSSLTDASAPGLETRGTFREVLMVFSRDLNRWTAGAGLGIFASDLTGTSSQSSNSGLGLSSYTDSLMGEVARASLAYRITDHLEAGVTADLLFGTDVGFDSGPFASGKSMAWLAGIQTLYGFDLGGLRLKAGARYFASLDLPERRLGGVQGVFEAAFAL